MENREVPQHELVFFPDLGEVFDNEDAGDQGWDVVSDGLTGVEPIVVLKQVIEGVELVGVRIDTLSSFKGGKPSRKRSPVAIYSGIVVYLY